MPFADVSIRPATAEECSDCRRRAAPTTPDELPESTTEARNLALTRKRQLHDGVPTDVERERILVEVIARRLTAMSTGAQDTSAGKGDSKGSGGQALPQLHDGKFGGAKAMPKAKRVWVPKTASKSSGKGKPLPPQR